MPRKLLALVVIVALLAGVASPAVATNCSVFRSWSTGDSLTASDLTTSFSTLNGNLTPACLDDASADATAMNTTTDPNSAGSASLPTSLTGELQRLRHVLDHTMGWTQWWTHYEDINFADRAVRNHLLVSTAANTRSIARGEMTGSGTATRFHAVAWGFVNQGVHHETALLRYHQNVTTQVLMLGLGGHLHLGGTLRLGSPGAVTHAALFLGEHTNTGLYWPLHDALAVTIKGGTNNGGEVVRFHTGGLMAGVDGSYDLGTISGSRFRGLHLTSTLYIGNGAVNASMTRGLTINQGAADDEALALKSSDIAHELSESETETYFSIAKASGTTGGALIRGLAEHATTGLPGIRLEGYSAGANQVRGSSARAAIELFGLLNAGTGVGTDATDMNLVAIRDSTGSRFIFDSEGTGHADDVWTDNAYDLAEEYDVDEVLDEGTVVTVDRHHDNRLTATTAPYQIVAGIRSYHTAQLKNTFGNLLEKYPQLALHEYVNPTPIALVGLVPTRVTTENGLVRRGDVLVSSSRKGHAMRVDDARAMTLNPRYVVGVALSECAEDVCLVNVQR